MVNERNQQISHKVIVRDGDKTHELLVEDGSNLRHVLLEADLSPYAVVTQRLNCGGRGLCATCGVWIDRGIPDPQHWHDRLAAEFGYPRLSCQITVESDMEVVLLSDKWVWGKRDPSRKMSVNS